MGEKAPMTSPADMSGHQAEEGRRAHRLVTAASVGLALVLIALKAFAYWASGSVSILASLADSGLDLLASLGAFYAVRWAAEPPDDEHRFGHGKGEALAALVQAGLVFASAIFVGWEAVRRLFDPQPIDGGLWGVGVVLISLVLTSGLIWLQTQALKKRNSMAVAGDRVHYAADMAANLVVLIGVVSGAFLDAPGLDAAAGLVVAVWLFWGALGLLKPAADHLLDREAPEADSAAVAAAATADPRVLGVHRLRTRMAGATLIAQMHMDLDAELTFEEVHEVMEAAERRILERFPEADVLIHPDPRRATQ